MPTPSEVRPEGIGSGIVCGLAPVPGSGDRSCGSAKLVLSIRCCRTPRQYVLPLHGAAADQIGLNITRDSYRAKMRTFRTSTGSSPAPRPEQPSDEVMQRQATPHRARPDGQVIDVKDLVVRSWGLRSCSVVFLGMLGQSRRLSSRTWHGRHDAQANVRLVA